ncbi:hypothetical protein [Dankookia sp. P2]|uniref:hypothetical protein n=1 Tax=Dankookia sp. P2 TaxID=3423955 RepID=UPI003D6661D7
MTLSPCAAAIAASSAAKSAAPRPAIPVAVARSWCHCIPTWRSAKPSSAVASAAPNRSMAAGIVVRRYSIA